MPNSQGQTRWTLPHGSQERRRRKERIHLSWLFGSKQNKERKKALKIKEREAYIKSYEAAKIRRASKRGRQAGSQGWMDRIAGAGAGLERSMAASNRAADTLMGGLGGSGGLFGFEEPQRRRAHKPKRKR